MDSPPIAISLEGQCLLCWQTLCRKYRGQNQNNAMVWWKQQTPGDNTDAESICSTKMEIAPTALCNEIYSDTLVFFWYLWYFSWGSNNPWRWNRLVKQYDSGNGRSHVRPCGPLVVIGSAGLAFFGSERVPVLFGVKSIFDWVFMASMHKVPSWAKPNFPLKGACQTSWSQAAFTAASDSMKCGNQKVKNIDRMCKLYIKLFLIRIKCVFFCRICHAEEGIQNPRKT